MTPHVHISFLSFMIFAAQWIIMGFLWHAAAVRLAARDSEMGKAMAFIG